MCLLGNNIYNLFYLYQLKYVFPFFGKYAFCSNINVYLKGNKNVDIRYNFRKYEMMAIFSQSKILRFNTNVVTRKSQSEKLEKFKIQNKIYKFLWKNKIRIWCCVDLADKID